MKTKVGVCVMFIIGVLAGVYLSSMTAAVFAAKPTTIEVEKVDFKLVINGKNAVDRPVAIDGISYLPLRTIAEVLNLDVDWDADSRTVIVTERDDE